LSTNNPVGSTSRSLYVGVDGGGSKTKAVIGYASTGGDLQIVGAGQGGPSNPSAIGFDAAFSNIRQAIVAAFQSAGVPQQPCLRAVLCLAGAGREEEKLAVERWVKLSGIANEAQLVSEAEAILAAATLNRQSAASEVALICGTGSLAWGRNINSQKHARSGGWGYLLGDEGSAFWIGQRLIQLACKAADRRNNHDDILASVLGSLSIEHPSQLVSWCYGDEHSRLRIAALAPIAFELQEHPEIAELINTGARELALMVASVVEQLGSFNYTLAVAGSVLLQQHEYFAQVIHLLSDRRLTPLDVCNVSDPTLGALRIAVQ
jgi:N-acetylglucosamine kinase-like BadF-type ATPase